MSPRPAAPHQADTIIVPTEPRAGLPGMLASPIADTARLSGTVASLTRAMVGPLLERLTHHRIDGLAHRALSRLPRGVGDVWLRAALKRRYERQCAAALVHGMALAEVLDAMERAGVPTSVLGGLRYGEWIYGATGLRPCGTHVLLVLPRDRGAARAVLARSGFALQAPRLHRRGGMTIDLRVGTPLSPSRGCVGAFRLPLADLFARGAPGRVAGGPALLLGAEDELLLLAFNLVRHAFTPLLRVADLAFFLSARGASLHREVVRERAAAAGLRRVLARAFASLALVGITPPVTDDAGTGVLETALMRSALSLRPRRGQGVLLAALAAPSRIGGLRFLGGALLAACADRFGAAPAAQRGGGATVRRLPDRVAS